MVDVGLAHGDMAHLADPLVVPATESPNRYLREAPQLAALQQDLEHAGRVQLPLKSLRDVGGA